MGWTKRVVAALALIAAGFLPASAQAPRKVALIIANADYGSPAANLPNTAVDAGMVTRALKEVGFEVEAKPNLRVGDMRAALATFQQRAEGAEVALVYFAGHGMEAGGKNWLIPARAQLRTDADLNTSAIEANLFAGGTQGAKTRIVVLDACRNNPFAALMQSTGVYMIAQQGGLSGLGAQTKEQGDILMMFSAPSGGTASDGIGGEGSPFARAFARHITEGGIDFRQVVGKITESVLNDPVSKQQRPFTAMSVLGGEPIYLAGPPTFTVEAAIARRAEEESQRQMTTLLQRDVRAAPGGTALAAAQGRMLSMFPASNCGSSDFGGEALLLDAGLAQAELLRVAINCQRFAVDSESASLGAFYANYFAGKAFRLIGELQSAERTLLAAADFARAVNGGRGPDPLTPTRSEAELLLAKVYAAQARKADAVAMLARAREGYTSLAAIAASRRELRRLALDGIVNVALTSAETQALPPRDDIAALISLQPLLDPALHGHALATTGRQQIAEVAVVLGEAQLREGSLDALQRARIFFQMAQQAKGALRAEASRENFLLGVTMMRLAGLAGPDDPVGCTPNPAISQPALQQALQYFVQAGAQSGLRWQGCALTALGNWDAAQVAFARAGDENSKKRAADLREADERRRQQ